MYHYYLMSRIAYHFVKVSTASQPMTVEDNEQDRHHDKMNTHII